MSRAAPSGSAGSRWWPALGATLAAAAILRLCNLGTFSFGLDEGFTITRAVLPFRDMIAACAADATNPPLYLVIAYGSLRLGLVDPWLRLVPIAAGLASIVAWSWWARRHFGSAASLLLAGFMALSTYHVRYSQELRAYPYLILLSGIAMLVGDRLRTRPGPRPAAALAVLVALGWYLHFSFALVLAPLVGLVLFGREQAAVPEPALRRKSCAWLVAALAAGTAAFLPWFLSVHNTLGGRLSQGANDWSLELLGRRWQFLTVAASEGEAVDWLGGALAVVAVAGLAVALRRRVGRTVLLSAVAAIVVSEALMVAVNRWTQGRYNAAVWPLLAILIALGLERLTRGLRWRWLRAAALAALALLMLVRVDAFHRLGRPHWDRVAAAIEQTRRPGEPVLCENSWSQLYVDYYLGEPVASLRHSTDRLRAAVAESDSVLLFVPAREGGREIPRLARRGALIARIPQTGTLYRLRPDSLGLDPGPAAAGWPEPAAALVAAELEDPPQGCVGRLFGRTPPPDRAVSPWSRLELDGPSDPFLRSGWSRPRVTRDSASFRWVTGREAAVVAPRPSVEAARVSLRLLPLPGLESQELRLLVNGHELGTRTLGRGAQTVELDAPAECWREGPNLLVIQLRQVVDPGDRREQPRSAAVDWIEIAPAPQRGSTAVGSGTSSSR